MDRKDKHQPPNIIIKNIQQLELLKLLILIVSIPSEHMK